MDGRTDKLNHWMHNAFAAFGGDMKATVNSWKTFGRLFETNNDVVAQKTAKGGAVDRLTDTSKYTGSHKERFDDEGKGKGVAGRKDIVDDSGYVAGYKEKDTYGKKTEDE